jgi:hypothetical protein
VERSETSVGANETGKPHRVTSWGDDAAAGLPFVLVLVLIVVGFLWTRSGGSLLDARILLGIFVVACAAVVGAALLRRRRDGPHGF